MKLTLKSPQMILLKDLSSCVQLVVDDFTESVFEEYIDFPLERRKMITAEKAVSDFEVAVNRVRDLITSSGYNTNAEIDSAFSQAKDAFNLAAASFNNAVARFDRRTLIYMKCSPLTRGVFSPREGDHWDPWADDISSPRRAEFAEISFVVIALAVFGLFAAGSVLSSYNIGKMASVDIRSLSSVDVASLSPRLQDMTSSLSSCVPEVSDMQKMTRFLDQEFWKEQREKVGFQYLDNIAVAKESIKNVALWEWSKLFKHPLNLNRSFTNFRKGDRTVTECLRVPSSSTETTASLDACPARQPFKRYYCPNDGCGGSSTRYHGKGKLLATVITSLGIFYSPHSSHPLMSAGMKRFSALKHTLLYGKREE